MEDMNKIIRPVIIVADQGSKADVIFETIGKAFVAVTGLKIGVATVKYIKNHKDTPSSDEPTSGRYPWGSDVGEDNA